MRPFAIRLAQGQNAAKETMHNGEPPASTLAAQIVDDLTRGKTHPKHQDQERFRSLLREILDTNNEDGEDNTQGIETNTKVNCRLIYVVIRAGLEASFNADPFEKQDELNKQALESLSVVDLTLRRCPEVLFTVLERAETDLQLDGPLYLWLVPRLFTVLGRNEDREVRLGVLRVLQTSVLVGRKGHPKQIKFQLVLKYIQGCVKDLLFLVGEPYSVQRRAHGLPELLVPTMETILEVFPIQLQQAYSLSPVQVCVQDRSQASVIIMYLLLSITSFKAGELRPRQTPQGFFTSLDISWTLSCLTRLWDSLGPAVENSVPWYSSEQCLVIFLEMLRGIMLQLMTIKYETVNIFRTLVLFSRIIATLLLLKSDKLIDILEKSICLSLFEIARLFQCSMPFSEAFDEHLLPTLVESRSRLMNFGIDLQQSISLVIRLRTQTNDLTSLQNQYNQSLSFQDIDLQKAYDKDFQSSSHREKADGNDRPRKRVRLSISKEPECEENMRSRLLKSVSHILGSHVATVSNIAQIAVDRFPGLSEDDQFSVFSIIGQLSCASAQTLSCSAVSHNGQLSNHVCSICDAQIGCIRPVNSSLAGDPGIDELFTAIETLFRLIQKPKWRGPRIAVMLALRRLLSHSTSFVHLDLSKSVLGQWCLQSMRSSLRDLRIASGRTIPVFLQEGIDESILLRNRISALDFLRSLSEASELGIQETCILAWGQIAHVSRDDEMNIVLLRLTEYLGHTNPLLCGIAYDEIQKISKHSPFIVGRLFRPYWRTVAPTVVKDLQRRPQIAQYISDLLGISVPEFLSLSQVYTIPYLVLTKNREVLQKIANASGRTTKALCMDHTNMAAILAYILLQSSGEMESVIMNLLNAVSSEFSNLDCAELVRAEPILTASELLKAAGEDNDVKKAKAHEALSFLASITHGMPVSSRGTARKTDTIGFFFETHVLGIMAHLADTINDGKEPQAVSEKIRCLGAVQEMIKLAKSRVGNGLPQICACLRSAIDNRELSNPAFMAWIAMIGTLGGDEISALVDPTFAIIAQYWESFNPRTQQQAHDAVSRLLKSHASTLRDTVKTIPSLASIPLMSKFEEELGNIRAQMDVKHQYQAFSERCRNENVTVVLRALIELETYLTNHQRFLHEASMHEQPDPVVSQLVRSVLDACVLFNESHPDISVLCAKCIGLIGCLDPTRVEAVRDKKEMLLLSNFGEAEETKDFVVFFCREVLVMAFLSATNPRSQGFLAYAMQELLNFIQFDMSVMVRSRDLPFDPNYYRWVVLPESVKNTLTPFLNSKYVVTAGVTQRPCNYPIYNPDMAHRQWLRTFVFDLLRKGVGDNVQRIFPVLGRIIRGQDISISDFLIPFAALNVVVSGTESQKLETAGELLVVLDHTLPENEPAARDSMILCSQNVFQVLDYFSRWMQEKRKELANSRMLSLQNSRAISQNSYETELAQIRRVESVLNMVPAEIISRRAVECRSFARALFHWEQYIRQRNTKSRDTKQIEDMEPLYERLQDIYTQIDEPDGIEGISVHLHVLNIDQQILEHRKAGRWTAAQSWYELQLTTKPNDVDVQFNLLTSLKESGQHDVLLNQIDGFLPSQASSALSLPFAAEASWVTGKWSKLRQYLSPSVEAFSEDFNVKIGGALLALSEGDVNKFSASLNKLRQVTARGLSSTNTASLQACHEAMLRFHAITEVEAISGVNSADENDKSSLLSTLDKRLDLLGAFVSDKQYLLGLRRATMQLSNFSSLEVASAWLKTAKLARKGDFTHSAFNAVLHASQLGDVSATIEHSRLLWREGHHRKAIQSLEGAIAVNAFRSHDYTQPDEVMITTIQGSRQQQQNLVKAKAYLLLAKWVDKAGQTQSDIIISQYKNALESCNRWEKGHYYLGKHYNKLLESEKSKLPGKQAQTFITGETAKLVVENYLRSLAFGAKYIYQTLPRILTLWLELGSDAEQSLDPKYGNDENFRSHATTQRRKMLGAVNTQIKKYVDRLPPFAWYTALSQIVARICQGNQMIYHLIVEIVTKVVIGYPQQALWTLLAVVKSSSKDRASRGQFCLSKIIETGKTKKSGSNEMMTLIAQAQKLSDQLLRVCEGDILGKPTTVSISKHLGFIHKTAPCRIAIPLESMLTASLPTITENVIMKSHKAFPKDIVTISSFLDDVFVLNSLQRPRKISIRGSDGHVYALLCKPKDDLRKDQRLMEFNAMINRSLKKDAESSKRRLYIKTYAVTPLNEECGLIEWVDKLKTLREILLSGYKQKNINVNYAELKILLTEASSDKSQLHIFTDKVIAKYPPIFHEWFVEMFPEPEAWFAARLRYTRSCAVMSVVGHVLGLGDRHGENILFEEGSGGTFHVDFNCLFDKGLTFDKPELVPFRLTHNMVDAFGAYGYEGPFRKSCELTLAILRQNEDTLMTILETFLYDPTTDFIGKKKKKKQNFHSVPDTPEGVLDSVRNKVRGLLPLESVPLSVEGYVQELVQQAIDPFRLASMYIGWCAFF